MWFGPIRVLSAVISSKDLNRNGRKSVKEPAGVLRKMENSAVTPVLQCGWLASWSLGNFPLVFMD